MDVVDLLEQHQAVVDQYSGYDWETALSVFSVVAPALVLGIALMVYAKKIPSARRKSLVNNIGLIGFAVGWIGMLVMVVAPNYSGLDRIAESEEQTIASIADAATDYYGVSVDSTTVKRALAAADKEVVQFSATHDGVDKSLGINISDVNKLTVYQGNIALKAAK